MAARKEPPSQAAMMKKRMGSISKELAALSKAGKGDSETYRNKMKRYKKYERAMAPKSKGYVPHDYAKSNAAAAKASTGTRAVAALAKKRRGPLSSVADIAKAGAARAKDQPTAENRSGTSRGAYERTKNPRK